MVAGVQFPSFLVRALCGAKDPSHRVRAQGGSDDSCDRMWLCGSAALTPASRSCQEEEHLHQLKIDYCWLGDESNNENVSFCSAVQ